ncbi:MAG: hypothetical protein ACD_75C01366G0003 [uncultured bacterium]|nr:MAG: hypothetical protein ACD_75C01366G0003 [uncultured bacterium]
MDDKAFGTVRRSDQGPIDMLHRCRPAYLRIGIVFRLNGDIVDIEDNPVDTIGAEIVKRFHENFDILAVDNDGLVIVRLGNPGGGRLIGLYDEVPGP